MEAWTLQHSKNLYRVDDWGAGYFDLTPQGTLAVRPSANAKGCDLHELVCSLTKRGIPAPILFRFEGIIQDRMHFIENAFDNAMRECNYTGCYRLAFPIKVNQQRHVVDAIRSNGNSGRLALEVGSKPELLAVLAMHDTPGGLLLCNGYKDREYIELALLAKRIGRRSIIIIEQLYELEQVLETSERIGVQAEIGLRFKPSLKGQGRWEGSSGDRAKFGLTTHELLLAIDLLKSHGKTSWVKLLHYHIGSQISAIGAIKRVLKEATRMYCEVARSCPELSFIDVGGGLAIDYDGSRTGFESSMNYSVEEYARDVVSAIQEACDQSNLPHPDIFSESGRAVVAHHAVLVVEATHVAPALGELPDLKKTPSEHDLIESLIEIYNTLSPKNCQESLHDTLEIKNEILNRFILGDMSLEERSYAERLYQHILAKIHKSSQSLKYIPEDFEKLDDALLDTYFCNFSVFQSLPDSWAIGNLFPIMPIHRLNEEPTRRGTIADLTCDSDGKIDRFIDLRDVSKYIRLHDTNGDQPYYLAIFLVGAYQEILGDLHNLFGDTNAVHVVIRDDGSVELPYIVEGDTIREVLEHVQYDTKDLLERLRVSVERGLKEGQLTPEESAKIQRRYREALEGYTYLVNW